MRRENGVLAWYLIEIPAGSYWLVIGLVDDLRLNEADPQYVDTLQSIELQVFTANQSWLIGVIINVNQINLIFSSMKSSRDKQIS